MRISISDETPDTIFLIFICLGFLNLRNVITIDSMDLLDWKCS